MTFRNIGIINSFLIVLVGFTSSEPWYFMILTCAQLVFVPFTLHMVMKSDLDASWIRKVYPYLAIPAFASIILLNYTDHWVWTIPFASLYFMFTLVVAYYGLTRFLKRGFVHFQEFAIDSGLMYLAMGGAWFFAYELQLDTGFSPLMTWLTAIHFHYSAFLLPIFIGFLGRRIDTSRLYVGIGSAIVVSPLIVAVGITYSTVIEVLSVLLYMFGIYGIIALSYRTAFSNKIQAVLVRLSFTAIGLTIIFSLLYTFGKLSGLYDITINTMLVLHGVVNCLVFALIGLVGWVIETPVPIDRGVNFPVSHIRGKWTIGENVLNEKLDPHRSHNGLVTDMNVYESDIDLKTLAPSIIDFYENTLDYRMIVKVSWAMWFKPFAAVYRLISRMVKQINLPLSGKEIEMTGSILALDEEMDGRDAPRAWIRKGNHEVIFVALYSFHRNEASGRSYMNIALPLPGSAMVGILELNQTETDLTLTSKKLKAKVADSGIYLAVKNHLFKLPIEEHFHVKEVEEGALTADHHMWIFGLPFLKIEYKIYRR